MSDNLVGYRIAEGFDGLGGSVNYGPDQGHFSVGEALRDYSDSDGTFYVSDISLIQALNEFEGLQRVEYQPKEGEESPEQAPQPFGARARVDVVEASPLDGAILQGGEEETEAPAMDKAPAGQEAPQEMDIALGDLAAAITKANRGIQQGGAEDDVLRSTHHPVGK